MHSLPCKRTFVCLKQKNHAMKTKAFITFIFASLVSAVLFNSCQKAAELASITVQFKIPQTGFTYTPSQLKNGEVILYSDFIKVNIDSMLIANGLPGGLFSNPQITQMVIGITAPPQANFGWLQSARAVASSTQSFAVPVELANVVNNGGTGTTLTLTTNGAALPMTQAGCWFRLYGTLNGPVPYSYIQMYFSGVLQLTLGPS